ncbi:hypothetical protein V2J09_021768 [Rumex salicifolius]
MKEIVTVQVGGFANFVGSHFWNFQDELLGLADDPTSDSVFQNHCLSTDVLYRTGETHEGILTYTPRLVSIDLQVKLQKYQKKGALSTNRSEPRQKNLFQRSLYEEELGHSGSDNRHDDSQIDTREKEITESLENSVQFWTDFSKVHYHPQSLYEVNGLWTDTQNFNNYGAGKDVFSDNLRGDEMGDRLRFFIEECDHIQGIQYLIDDAGGFSSVGADFLEHIADEYTNTPVLLYAVRKPASYENIRSRKRMVSRDLHDAVSFSRLSPFCKLYVPIGLPFLSNSKASTLLHIDDEKAYHCSAVYASALHSLSLPFRMETPGPTANSNRFTGASDINSIVQMLTGEPRQNMVAILDAALPAHSLIGKQDEQPLLSSLQTLSPDIAEDTEDVLSVESMVIQGALWSGGERASVSEVQESICAAYEHASIRPRFCHLSISLCPLPIPLPFPSIFNGTVGNHGLVTGNNLASGLPSKGSLDVQSIPMAARLRSSSAVMPFLKNRLENLRRFGIQRGAPGAELARSWGFAKDELEEMGESLSKMIKTLDPFLYASSDSD